MKVLIISRGYPTKKYNLNGIFEFDQAKALVKAGHEVIYAAIDMRSFRRWRKWGYESLYIDGVPIEAINIPCGRIHNIIYDKIKELALTGLYKRIMNKYGEPDVIHAHFLGMGYVSVKTLKDKNIPILLTEHLSSINQDILPSYLKRKGEFTYQKVDKLLTVSSLLSKKIEKNFSKENTVIPNIVDSSSFSFNNTICKDDGFTFISTGGLIKRKGMDILINAFYNAFANNNKIKLYVYGEGPERKNLEELITRLNLTKQVFLMGLVDRKIIAKKMQESHCFVLASKLETFGVVYIEAMAVGLPVIATRCGGPEDFVNDENGILIQVDSEDELSLAMLKIYNNYKQYNSEKISSKIIERYSSHNVARLIVQEYKKIIKEGL